MMQLLLQSSKTNKSIFHSGFIKQALFFKDQQYMRSFYNTSNDVKDVEFPVGFKASGLYCGIKKKQFNDLSIIHSSSRCVAWGVFTKNKFSAAPVLVTKQILSSHFTIDNIAKEEEENNKDKGIYSVIINSGCANAVTGEQGLLNAYKMVDETDLTFNDDEGNTEINNQINKNKLRRTLVLSTGVIGHQLNMEKIINSIPKLKTKLNNRQEDWMEAAKGFMTTDTRPKLMHKVVKNEKGEIIYRIAGIAKGAGMIHPNMATLLSVVCTDANISVDCVKKALEEATERSFNAISIDGDTSTNDTCLLLANKMANNEEIQRKDSSEFETFKNELTKIMVKLAKMIVMDAEGATKFVTVRGANSYESAKVIASKISTSSLVKTALFGNDANWGRIICAIGYSGIDEIEPNKVCLKILALSSEDKYESEENNEINDEIELLRNGTPIKMDEDHALRIMQHRNLEIDVNLNIGNSEAVMWTCDLSHDYVTINGSYRS